MSSHMSTIINSCITPDKSYLELGCYIKNNFNKVNSNFKECVDIKQEFNPTYCMTTEKFFAQNSKKYDVIFIDANHDLDYVVADYNKATEICNKVIAIHDMYPPNEEQTASGYCSDSYKFLHYINVHKFVESYTLNDDYGLTFILPQFKKVDRNDIKQTSYSEFIAYPIKTYNTYDISNIIKSKII